MRTLFTLLLLALIATPVFGWGEAGHYLSNEAATFEVPYAMPRFFHDAYPGLVYLGYDPDRMRGAGDASEDAYAPDHFIDYEYVAGLTLPNKRFEFLSLLETSGTLKRYAIENSASGFLPWRVAETSELLERQWQLWKRSPSPLEKRQIERNIIYLAGTLGHFAADSANPHHTSLHYNGWASADNPEGFRTDCSTHYRFESEFVSRNVKIRDVAPLLRPVTRRDDYFAAAVEFVRESNSLLQQLYHIDRDGAFDGSGTPEGKRFAASRIAAGASWLRDLWWTTYVNGTQGRPK